MWLSFMSRRLQVPSLQTCKPSESQSLPECTFALPEWSVHSISHDVLPVPLLSKQLRNQRTLSQPCASFLVCSLVGLLVCNPAGLRSPILSKLRTCQHPDVWVYYKLFLAFLVIIDSLDFVYFLPCIVQPCNIAGFQLLQYTNIRTRSNGYDRLPAPLMY